MEEFQVYCLWDKSGLEVHISNYGAKILSMLVPDARGERVDVVLGFEKIDDWLTKEQYFNAIIGRCANRIKDARFMLDGREYHLPQNNGNNSLHGGINGFNRKYWDVVSGDASHIRLHYRAADGEEGFPGNLDTYVTYRVEGKSLHIEY